MEENFLSKNSNEIPSLNFRNYLSVSSKQIMKNSSSQNTQKKGALRNSTQTNRNRSLFSGIFTVAESLKENCIIKSLQPELGSLTSFIHLKEKPDFENYRKSLKTMK